MSRAINMLDPMLLCSPDPFARPFPGRGAVACRDGLSRRGAAKREFCETKTGLPSTHYRQLSRLSYKGLLGGFQYAPSFFANETICLKSSRLTLDGIEWSEENI